MCFASVSATINVSFVQQRNIDLLPKNTYYLHYGYTGFFILKLNNEVNKFKTKRTNDVKTGFGWFDTPIYLLRIYFVMLVPDLWTTNSRKRRSIRGQSEPRIPDYNFKLIPNPFADLRTIIFLIPHFCLLILLDLQSI